MLVLKRIFSRLNVTVFLITVQILLLAALFWGLVRYVPHAAAAGYALNALIVLALVRKEEAAAYKVVWIIIVMALPIAGGIIYLLFGNKRPSKRMKRRMEKERKLIAGPRRDESALNDLKTQNKRLAGCMRYIQKVHSYPVYNNSETKYYPSGELLFEDMLTCLASAKKFIFMEYFIISQGVMWDKVHNLLAQKAKEGLDVRLIYDDLGSIKLFNRPYLKKLKRENIKTVRFNKVVPLLSLAMNYRDHRKIMIIDEHTAFSGSVNIADEHINQNCRLGTWKDTGIRLKGGAVRSFTHMFLETWNAFCKEAERINDVGLYESASKNDAPCNGFTQPYGDSPLDEERVGENVYIEILGQAKRYIYIFTPYLIISDKMLYALQMAAKRGVDVRIVTPGVPDKKIVCRLSRSYYARLIKSGVKIYEYTQGFLHAKSFVCDDEIAVVGTINLDYRSLYLHFECAALLYGANAVNDIKEDAVQTIAAAREVTVKNCKRTFLGEFIDSVLCLFAPLM